MASERCVVPRLFTIEMGAMYVVVSLRHSYVGRPFSPRHPSLLAGRCRAPYRRFALDPQYSHRIRVGKGEESSFKMVCFTPSTFGQSLLEEVFGLCYSLALLEIAIVRYAYASHQRYVTRQRPPQTIQSPTLVLSSSHFLIAPVASPFSLTPGTRPSGRG